MEAGMKGWAFALGAAALVASASQPALSAGKSATFDVTAVHTGQGAQITINSKVWVTSQQARADVTYPGGKGQFQFLVTNGYFYQLKPDEKKGIRGPLPPEMSKNKDNFDMLVAKLAFDAGDVLKIAQKVRTESVAGFNCDVYSKSVSEGGKSRAITVWVPQTVTPRIPVKAVMEDKMVEPGASFQRNVTVTLSNLKVNVPIAPAVFKVPSNYKIATATPQKAKPGAKKPAAKKGK
jgi:hypothetical protein